MEADKIQEIISEMFSRLGVAVESIEVAQQNGRRCFRVRSSDSHLIIGAKGAHLFALNHLAKKIASKGEEERPDFSIDVNGYQEEAAENLKNLAQIMGERARSFKSQIELDPMSSYERMIVHSFFEGAKDLKTESVGAGNRRRVVIKYTGETFSPPSAGGV